MLYDIFMDRQILEKFKSGHFERGDSYKYFVPAKVNIQWVWSDPEINQLTEKASLKLGELNSFAGLVPSTDLTLHFSLAIEAVASSAIEGTQTGITEIKLNEEDIRLDQRNDQKEVINYIKALGKSIKDLEILPISSRLICKAHSTLLNSVRGEKKSPGDFRSSQNWIGVKTIQEADFVPPHHKLIGDLMGDLEQFLHNKKIQIPQLIRCAIVHYQFETIHPFLDGNGRIGRLLIVLDLIDKKLLDEPLLNLSKYFEFDKQAYYRKLDSVRLKNDMTGWIKYFLKGIIEISIESVETLKDILKLKEDLENRIKAKFGRRSAIGLTLLNELFSQWVVTVNQIKEKLNITYRTANELVKIMCEYDILVEYTGQTRNRLYVFKSYIDLLEGKKFFLNKECKWRDKL